MKKYKVSNLEKILDFGFLYKKPNNKFLSLKNIISEIQSNVLVFDTKGDAFYKFMHEAKDIVNKDSYVVVGLISIEMIRNLKKMGIVNGFYRSVMEYLTNHAIIIVDKTEVYIEIIRDSFLKISDKKVVQEIAEYLNFIMWTQTNFEVINQSSPREIKELRLSVPKPREQYITKIEQLEIATKDLNPTREVLLNKPEKLDIKAHVIPREIKSIGFDQNYAYVNIFKDRYIPVKLTLDQISNAESFKDKKVRELIATYIWYEGKEDIVEPSYELNQVIYQPLDTYQTYEPDYKKIIDKSVSKIYGEVNLNIDIKPIVVDNSYKLTPNYKKRNDILTKVDESIKKLMNLSDKEDYKKLEIISNLTKLSDKIQKYNEFLSDTEIGLEQLKSKKSNVQKININLSDITVPPELIGRLLMKDNQLYFALKDESKIDLAKQWMKENNVKATMVMDNETENN